MRRNIDDLFAYTYRTAHAEYVRRRAEWFERLKEMHMAFWYIPAGHIPTVSEAMDRIVRIREQGPSPYAFNFKRRFTADEALAAGVVDANFPTGGAAEALAGKPKDQ